MKLSKLCTNSSFSSFCKRCDNVRRCNYCTDCNNSITLTACRRCNNSENCINSIDCDSCKGCKMTIRSKSCTDCIYSKDLIRCINCNYSRGCKDCKDCFNTTDSEGCINCKYARGLKGEIGYNNSYDGELHKSILRKYTKINLVRMFCNDNIPERILNKLTMFGDLRNTETVTSISNQLDDDGLFLIITFMCCDPLHIVQFINKGISKDLFPKTIVFTL